MYSADSLHSLPGEALVELLKETHGALIGLLWQIEDYRNFDELAVESHFDDTVPMDRAQFVHRMLMVRQPKEIVERGFFRGEQRDEFLKWVERCKVKDSFTDAAKVLS